MYYLDNGSLNILANLYLDYHENKISNVTVPELLNWIKTNPNDFSKMISGITSTEHPLCIKSLSYRNKFFSNVTLDDIVIIKKQIPNIKSETLVKSFTNDWNRIYRKLPFDLLSLYDNKIDKSLGVLSLFKGKNYNKDLKFYQNNRDSILYLTDIFSLDSDIEVSKKSNIFTTEELSKLYSITFRLIIPKYISDMIKCDNKLEFLYKSNDNTMHFSNMKEHHNLTTEIQEFVRVATDNGNRYLDMFTGSTLYKVYLNMTFDELSKMITSLSEIEENYKNQIIGAVYYNLINNRNIESLFNLSNKVKTGIERRIYNREGN